MSQIHLGQLQRGGGLLHLRFGRLDLRRSISGTLPLAEAADAVARLTDKTGNPIRLILEP